MINWSPRLLRARDFFREAHDSIGQKRKYDLSPYWTHTERVAGLVSQVINDEDVIIAALGHDSQEDVLPVNPKYNSDLITKEFGENVTSLILQLTDVYTKESYPQFNRAKRKLLEAQRLGTITPEGKSLKICDLIDNTTDILSHDRGFGIQYLKEKEMILPYLKEGNQTLFLRAVGQLNENKRILNIE